MDQAAITMPEPLTKEIVYIVQKAVSGRSACKGKCKQPIPLNTWRFGSKVASGNHHLTFWRCLGCVTPAQTRSFLSHVGNAYDDIDDPNDVLVLKRVLEVVPLDEQEVAERAALISNLNSSASVPGPPRPIFRPVRATETEIVLMQYILEQGPVVDVKTLRASYTDVKNINVKLSASVKKGLLKKTNDGVCLTDLSERFLF